MCFKKIQQWFLKGRLPDPVLPAPVVPLPPYKFKHSSSEVAVISHVDGFFLQQVMSGKFRVMNYPRDHYDGYRYSWEVTREYRSANARYDWYLSLYKDKEEAIQTAQNLEKSLDDAEDERIRRETFVEQKVWR